jgi:hypothetical protein
MYEAKDARLSIPHSIDVVASQRRSAVEGGETKGK